MIVSTPALCVVDLVQYYHKKVSQKSVCGILIRCFRKCTRSSTYQPSYRVTKLACAFRRKSEIDLQIRRERQSFCFAVS